MERQTNASQQFPWSLSCKLPRQGADTVSSQDIRSFLFPVTFLFKTHTTLFFFMKSQCSVLDFCHLTIFSNIMNISTTFQPSFLVEARQILERSQQIQIL